jgi:transposase-like protein
MQPDACSQQRSCGALEAVRFPILTFDEWQPGRPPGRGFMTDWLLPGESLVSILWKFACANALPGDVLMRLICPDADPLERVIPLRSALDLAQLRRLLRLPANVLRTSLLDRTPGERYHAAFRYCRQCAAHGYHSVLHQLTEEDRCAAHGQRLRTRCPQCRRESPFIINGSVIEAPFRCVWCRSHFCYGLLPVRSTTQAMRRQDRLAIQERVLLRLGSGASRVSDG